MKRLVDLLYGYRFSLLLMVLLFLYFFNLHGFNLFPILFQNILLINWKVFVLTAFTGYLGSISFVLPFYVVAKRQEISVSKLFLETLKWVHQNIINIDYDKVFLRNMKIKGKAFFTKVKICDVVTILVILTLAYPFISFNIRFFFFVFIFELVYIFFLILANFSIVKEILFFIPVFLLRYLLEVFTPFLIFLSVGIFLDLPTLFFFTASTSLLYYIPKFKLAGGILDLYLVLMFHFMEKPILGLVVAILFRFSSLFFFVLPLSILKKFNLYYG